MSTRIIVFLALAGIVGFVGAGALDHFVLHPQRQHIKVLRYNAAADAKRISQLEQDFASLNTGGPPVLSPSPETLACIKASIARIKADYDAIPGEFRRCRAAVAASARAWLAQPTEPELFALFVTALTSQLGEYGLSDETDARRIARDAVLNCSQSMYFVAQTLKAFYPQVDVTEVNLDNAALGEHGLVEARFRDRTFVLDGLTGTIFFTSIDEMVAANSRRILSVDFFDETDERLAVLLEGLLRSIQLGRIKPEHIVQRHPLQ